MTLAIDAGLTLGRLVLDVAADVDDGEVVAVLGPNGAGKTTLLRAVAGLQPLDRGRISIDGVVVDDPDAAIFVPPEHRHVGVVFQDYALFPHLSALDNVAFGLRARRRGRAAARAAALTWLDRVGLAERADDRPGALSGGQGQRVALARALAPEPRALVLDEPLAALDAATRADVRRRLRRHLDGLTVPTLLVTHDPADAHALADRVVVVEAGRVVQSGTLASVAAHPRSRYVADLVGVNLVHGQRRGDDVITAGGAVIVLAADDEDEGHHGEVVVTIRPQAVVVHRHRPESSARNVWPLTVADVESRPDRTRLTLTGPLTLWADVTAAAAADLALRPGAAVWASVKATDVTAAPA